MKDSKGRIVTWRPAAAGLAVFYALVVFMNAPAMEKNAENMDYGVARNATKALKIAAHIGNSARFALPAAVSALYMEFNRILRYGALLQRNPYPSQEDKARALAGVNPYFYRQYDQAVRNYPVPKAMKIISLLCEYDYLGKGGDGSVATDPGELLVELTAKILSA